jgi:hypothetical protein
MRQLTAHHRWQNRMNTEFLTHDHPHLMRDNATHPSALFLGSLPALSNPRHSSLVSDSLRLVRKSKNSTLGRVQLPHLG